MPFHHKKYIPTVDATPPEDISTTEALDNALDQQVFERRVEASVTRQCPLCPMLIGPAPPAEFIRHLYRRHGLSLGHPAGIVYTVRLIDLICERLLPPTCGCLSCPKVFPAPALLRAHMRKKQHLHLPAPPPAPTPDPYRGFWIRNYGPTPHCTASEWPSDASDEVGSFSELDEPLETREVECPVCAATVDEDDLWGHVEGHGVTPEVIKSTANDFYDAVKRWNNVQYIAAHGRCFACHTSVDREHCFDHAVSCAAGRPEQLLMTVVEADPMLGMIAALFFENEEETE